jgi:hypothetical protein
MSARGISLLLAGAALLTAQTKYQNRDAWTLDTPRLRVTVVQSGGHLVEVLLKEPGAVNPLWNQTRSTIDPDQYDPVRHEKLYGGGPGARLMSGLLGHNLCFPFWGNPSEAEYRAGMTYHGETGVARWRQVSAGADALTITAELPESRTRFTRTLQVKDQVLYADSLAENLAAWDRPVGWCEHVTLGPPFLEKGVTLIDAPLTRGRVNGDASGAEFRWPEGQGDTRLNLRTVRNVERSGFVNNFLIDPAHELGFFAAVHPGRRLLFGYVFRRADYPWLNIWEANDPEMLTRGLEFSNTPNHGTMRTLVATPALFGTPAYEWLEGRGRLRKRFAAFSARVPENYRGVAEVRVLPDRLDIVERETGRVISLPFEGARL